MITKTRFVISIVLITMAILYNTSITPSHFLYAQNNQKFVAILTPKEVIPPVSSQAIGIAEFTVLGNVIKYTVNALNIQGATTSHIHLGRVGTNGLNLATLFDNSSLPSDKATQSGELAKESGLFEYVTDLTTPMTDGDLYVDIQTTQNPNRELRG